MQRTLYLVVGLSILIGLEVLTHVIILNDPSGILWRFYSYHDIHTGKETPRFLIDGLLHISVAGLYFGCLMGKNWSWTRWIGYVASVAGTGLALLPVYGRWLPGRPLWWWIEAQSSLARFWLRAALTMFLLTAAFVAAGWKMRVDFEVIEIR